MCYVATGTNDARLFKLNEKKEKNKKPQQHVEKLAIILNFVIWYYWR